MATNLFNLYSSAKDVDYLLSNLSDNLVEELNVIRESLNSILNDIEKSAQIESILNTQQCNRTKISNIQDCFRMH